MVCWSLLPTALIGITPWWGPYAHQLGGAVSVLFCCFIFSITTDIPTINIHKPWNSIEVHRIPQGPSNWTYNPIVTLSAHPRTAQRGLHRVSQEARDANLFERTRADRLGQFRWSIQGSRWEKSGCETMGFWGLNGRGCRDYPQFRRLLPVFCSSNIYSLKFHYLMPLMPIGEMGMPCCELWPLETSKIMEIAALSNGSIDTAPKELVVPEAPRRLIAAGRAKRGCCLQTMEAFNISSQTDRQELPNILGKPLVNALKFYMPVTHHYLRCTSK